jgi:RND superfamily putative drug exporter
MAGMAASSLVAIVQMGVIIAIGLLLDTFVVRTITVPAIAVLLGNANWWPSKPPGSESGTVKPPQPLASLAPAESGTGPGAG